MRQPGLEPESEAWEASMIPLHHWRPAGRFQILHIGLLAAFMYAKSRFFSVSKMRRGYTLSTAQLVSYHF
jgi:hypothetical protein